MQSKKLITSCIVFTLVFFYASGLTQARPYPAQEAWPIGFGSGEITKVEWIAAPKTVKKLAEESPVADPINLKEMGSKALDQMLVTLLPDRMGYRPSQWGSALACPSFGWHQEYSEVAEQAGRAGTAFCLLRQAFGFQQGLDKEEGMYRVTAHHVKHGLPTQPLPDLFTKLKKMGKLEDPETMAQVNKIHDKELSEVTDEADLPYFIDYGFAIPLMVETWIMRYELTGDPALKQQIENAIQTIRSDAVVDPTGFVYYPTRGTGQGANGKAQWGGAYPNAGGGNLLPLAHWAKLTQDGDLMTFVRTLADGIVAGIAHPLDSEPLRFGRVRWDGSFEMDVSSSKWAWPGGNIPKIANPVLEQDTGDAEVPPVHWGMAHTLSHTTVIWGMAYAGMATDEPRYLDWAKRVYDHLLSMGNDSGWFQEHLPWPYPVLKDPRQHTETCITADMIDIAAFLAQAGCSDYWDHVERYARNYLSVMQFEMTPQFETYYRRIHQSKPPEDVKAGLKELKQRLEGGLAASCLLNDLVTGYDDEPSIDAMGCCVWSGARGIGRAGVSVLTETDDAIYVNLQINHDALHARVVSFLPSTGRVTVVAKQAGTFYLRPPAWAPRGQVRAYRNAKNILPDWKNNYITFKEAQAGEELTLTYPLPHFLQDISIAGRNVVDHYTLEWLGNTVVGISPTGKRLPLYDDRKAYLTTAGAKSFLK